MGVSAAVVGSAAVGAYTSSKAAGKAVDASKEAAALSTAEQRRQYDTTRQDFAPYRDVGGSALSVLADIYGVPRPASQQDQYEFNLPGGGGRSNPVPGLLGSATISGFATNKIFGRTKSSDRPASAADFERFLQQVSANPTAWDTPQEVEAGLMAHKPGARQQFLDGMQQRKLGVFAPKEDAFASRPVDRYGGFYESPNYQFRLNEGLTAVERSAAARGRLFSGAAVKAVNNYAQGTASDEWNNWLNGLRGLAGVGQSATGSTAAAGANAANVISNTAMNSGAQRASAYMAGAEGVNNAVQGGLGNWVFYNAMKK